ncbi:sorting nexin-29-like [Xenia sp. Carnegie-2017]|uniref:sorting nexin-29-like n=1 Tax=Xenia sp. Carnegie-2017 TaxID=2897299 RepID=UPI001F03B051|nr:sorting nexin-29-like [Xenia sp. Carnegie-2017]XP_046863041.1 sorting nexin-29-like [Xenia sp. Carnegie-2017]
MSVNTRPLINIWIPSVFVQGKSPNIHHSYQVYIRIKDDEWNVYKRYSDFYALYKKTSKQFKPVAQFTFPAKKIIGNRDVNFVETRRKQLENYLRKLINYSLGAVPELGENPCKSCLFKYFPFFMQTSTVSSVSTTTTTTQTVPSTHKG